MENREEYIGTIIKNKNKPYLRLMVGIPMTGLLRSEWVLARYGQIIPTNWSHVDTIQFIDQYSPIGFSVADARNIIATLCVEKEFEWLWFIDHDTILPPDATVRVNQHMIKKEIPVFSGLYFTKSKPAEPLLYRGRGSSYYTDWKLGDEVWVDGIPMGCTVIHSSLLKVMYDESEQYKVGDQMVRKIFETPAKKVFDPEQSAWLTETGTEDIKWCHRVITERIFDKAGWHEYQEKEYPFMVDTNIFCKHIDWNGNQFPSIGEEQYFLKK